MNHTPSIAPVGVESLAAARRKQRRSALRAILLFVVAPTLLVGLYRGLFQSKFYVSYAIVSVEANGPTPIDARHDAMVLREFATSRDALRVLIARGGYLRHFSAPSLDRLSRIPAHPSFESAYDHFRDHVDVDLDSETGFLNVRVRAHSGREAHDLCRTLVDAMRERARDLGRADGDATSPPTRRLAVIAAPSTPDRAAGPKVLRSIATIFFASIALFIIGSIVIAIAKEHADV